MRRRLLAAALVLLPFPLVLSNGCGSGEPTVENLCGWLGDPENCFAKFVDDVGAQCGAEGVDSAPKGGFAARDKLDVCLIDGGGQVAFDPPLDVATFPLASIAFKLTDKEGNACGSGSITTPPYIFSMTINAYPLDGGTAPAGDAGAPTGEPISGGTFAVASGGEGRQTFDTTCPSGEAHHFDRYSMGSCQDREPLLPRAEIVSNPGSVNNFGFVLVRVYYPTLGDDHETITTRIVEYFNCSIPKAPLPCVDMALDGNETDVDCGGPDCAKCPDDSKCKVNEDCISGNCAPNMANFLACLPGAGTGATTGAATTTAATGAGGGGGAGGAGAGGAGGN